jgi:predicted esterase
MLVGRVCAMSIVAASLAAACAHPEPVVSPTVTVSTAVAVSVTPLPTVVASAVEPPPPSALAPSAPVPPPWPPAPPAITSPFCLAGVMDTLAEDLCYVLPERPTKTLLIYLPGLMPPTPESPEKRGVETVVAKASRRAGVAALLLRGPSRDELAAPAPDPKGLGAYRSWPTSDGVYRAHARAQVERMHAAQRALEALVGAPFQRVFLGGSSAGAYFVGHLALRGDFPADGYLVLSGGSGRPAPALSELEKRLLYVGYGDGDITGPKAEEVARQARAAGWKVKVAMHHTGHGSREVYLDEAFAFFGVTSP